MSGDGVVSVDEISVALGSLNTNATRADAEKLIEEALGAKKVAIDWTEFCRIIETGLTENTTAAQMFELLDTRGLGQLSPEVLRAALQKYGCDSSDAAIDKMIRYIDMNFDGMVSLMEFAEALRYREKEGF